MSVRMQAYLGQLALIEILGNSVCGKQKPLISIVNLHLLHANNKGADQPAYLRSLISSFVIGYLESITSKLASL